jgi:superfamily II DNA/RNA helicase
MSIQSTPPDERDRIASEYFEQLLYPPYQVQEESLLAWFTSEHGVLVCAPTGTGKTLIAEGAVYEALRTGQRCYYTTPLIALTDQKLQELQQAVLRWGFPLSSVGLVTGNRRVNPDAPILVVVAEILLNRLLQSDADPMDDVSSVVMDEFHSFNDPERGIVWELSIGLLPPHVRLMLLSATIGNSVEFCNWMLRAHGRKVELVQSSDRKIPLQFEWVDDAYLDEHLERITAGDEVRRRTPGLVFCFNRDQCWQVADLLRGKKLIDKERQAVISKRLDAFDLSQGAGPKLKQILIRGVGVHHAGILPKYRRIVEELFQEKLLSVCVCTETLSAGINLPARSVILPRLVKGPYGKQKLIEPSTAQQIFGRAGRPQFDREGFVYAIAHEDDVKYNRWKLQYDQIPEDTRDPNLIKAKKQLKKKMPTRRAGETYWSKEQFEKLRSAPAAKLASRGPLPWRLLAHMLRVNPEVQPLRDLVGKRLLPPQDLAKAQVDLNRMLVTLWTAGFLELEPKPQPKSAAPSPPPASRSSTLKSKSWLDIPLSVSSQRIAVEPNEHGEGEDEDEQEADSTTDEAASRGYELESYRPDRVVPRPRLELLSEIRSVNPIYGLFLIGHLQFADECERIQALESVLELPANIAKTVRVPPPDQLPFGPLATDILHPKLLELGLAGVEEITGVREEDDDDSDSDRRSNTYEPPPRPLALGEKLRRLFDYDFPGVHDVYTRSVWVVSELLQFEGDFNKYILAHGLQKQEGMLFRHVLRFILLLNEISGIAPENTSPEDWEVPLDSIAERLIDACRRVDPQSTDEVLQELNDPKDERSRRRSS